MIKSARIGRKAFILSIVWLWLLAMAGIYGQDTLNLSYNDNLEIGQSTNMGWLLFRYVLAVVAVIALTALGARYIAARFQPDPGTSGNWVQILDQMSVGTNKGLMLVEIEGKGYVLGISDHSINVISTIDSPERLDELRMLTVKPPTTNIFSPKLFQKKTKEDFNQSLEKQLQRTQSLRDRGGSHD